MTKYLKSIAVLASICLVLAALLGVVNMITGPIIRGAEERKVQEALAVVLPGTTFTKVNPEDGAYAGVEFPESLLETYSAANGGYVFKLDVKGYSTGLVLLIGVDAEGKVSGTQVISSNETNGAENSYGSNFVGKNLAGAGSVATVSGSTLTTTAFKGAVVTALELASQLKSIAVTQNGGN